MFVQVLAGQSANVGVSSEFQYELTTNIYVTSCIPARQKK